MGIFKGDFPTKIWIGRGGESLFSVKAKFLFCTSIFLFFFIQVSSDFLRMVFYKQVHLIKHCPDPVDTFVINARRERLFYPRLFFFWHVSLKDKQMFIIMSVVMLAYFLEVLTFKRSLPSRARGQIFLCSRNKHILWLSHKLDLFSFMFVVSCLFKNYCIYLI